MMTIQYCPNCKSEERRLTSHGLIRATDFNKGQYYAGYRCSECGIWYQEVFDFKYSHTDIDINQYEREMTK